MIRKVSLIIACLVVAISAQSVWAQVYYHPTFDVGFKGGVSMSNMQFSPSVEQKMRQGIIFGASVRYCEEKLFGLMAELKYVQRGWKEDFKETSFSYDRVLNYVELPVMTHINFGSQKVRGFVNLGPSVSYMLSNSASANFDYMHPETVEGFPIDNRHVSQMALEVKNKIDYGIVGGVGVEFRVKKRHCFLLEGRYYFGLGNIYSNAKKDEFSASRSTSIEVSLGYMFRLKD